MGFSISYALLSSVLVIAPAYAPPTIGTDDIEDNAITSPKIKDGEIMTSDIANGAVTKDKLNPNAVKLVVVQREKSFTLTPHSQWSAII